MREEARRGWRRSVEVGGDSRAADLLRAGGIRILKLGMRGARRLRAAKGLRTCRPCPAMVREYNTDEAEYSKSIHREFAEGTIRMCSSEAEGYRTLREKKLGL